MSLLVTLLGAALAPFAEAFLTGGMLGAARSPSQLTMAAAGPPASAHDVAVVGSGPAGCVMATLLSTKHGLDVAIIDPNIDETWIPNYGVWVEEWEKLDDMLDIGLRDCLRNVYEVTDCFYGSSHGVPANERLRLNRPYAQVRKARQDKTVSLCCSSCSRNVKIYKSYLDVGAVEHHDTGSNLKLEDGTSLGARMVVDCSGHESKLIERQGPHDPGFQIAYGIECEVKDGNFAPYAEEAMLFMDYRADYATAPNDSRKHMEEVPTFLYAMPQDCPSPLLSPSGGNKIFFEETSLVARPKISFDLCKERLYRRLAHHGIEVTKVEGEEFCYIPMGGSLPRFDQRVVSFGGAAGFVHAATGYMIVRMLAGSKPAADAMAKELKKDVFSPDLAAQKVYYAMWPAEARLQRSFHVFGGEFLMQQDATNLRGFFNGFFKIDLPLWAGFLSGYPGLPHNEKHRTWGDRFMFGVQFFLQLPNSVKFKLALAGALEGLKYGLLDSVTPLANRAHEEDAAFQAEVAELESQLAAKARPESGKPVKDAITA
ncbi:unnamed protein product [Chrysoparadoxa australica]